MAPVVADSCRSTCDAESRAIWSTEYLLLHCEGFVVDCADGHLGLVADLEELDDGTVDLVVTGSDETFRVNSREITDFDPYAERVVIVAAPCSGSQRRVRDDER